MACRSYGPVRRIQIQYDMYAALDFILLLAAATAALTLVRRKLLFTFTILEGCRYSAQYHQEAENEKMKIF